MNWKGLLTVLSALGTNIASESRYLPWAFVAMVSGVLGTILVLVIRRV